MNRRTFLHVTGTAGLVATSVRIADAFVEEKPDMLKDTVYAGDLKVRMGAQVLKLSDLESRFAPGTRYERSPHVMAPGHLVARKLYLEKQIADLSKFQPRECICFAFGVGEDLADRATTRLGGLPFWPKKRQWPKAQDGSTKEFIGQFDFRPVTWPEPLPGDILTVPLTTVGPDAVTAMALQTVQLQLLYGMTPRTRQNSLRKRTYLRQTSTLAK